MLLCDGEMLIDIVRRGGQGVLNVLAIGGVKTDLDASLLQFSDPDGAQLIAAQAV